MTDTPTETHTCEIHTMTGEIPMLDLILTGIHMLDAPYMMTHTGLVLLLKQDSLIQLFFLAETVLTPFVDISHYSVYSVLVSNLKAIISSLFN